MPQTSAATISCPHCGRAFTWKASLAGKKGKCSCGRIMVIPEAPPVPPPVPPPAEEEDLDALYDLAEPAPEAAPEPPPSVRSATVSLAYAAPAKEELAYDALTDNRRDIYIPTGLLIAGFLGILIWAVTRYDLPPGILAIVSLISGITTAVKTLIIVGLAILFAPALGVSFGLLRTAVLKFAAILVFTDAALLWLEVIMEATGAIPTSGRYYVRGTATVNLLLATAIIGFLIHTLFDMDADEMGKIAVAMAVLSRLIGWGMNVLVVVMLTMMFAPGSGSAPAPAAAPAATAGVGVDSGGAAEGSAGTSAGAAGAGLSAPDAIRIIETAEDREIAQRIAKSPLVKEGSEARYGLTSVRGMRELLDRAQVAGAVKIHIDLEGGKRLGPAKAYIELPADPAARARCFSEAGAVCQTYRHQIQSASDSGQRYLVVLFRQ